MCPSLSDHYNEALDAFDKGDHKTAIFNFKEVLKDKEYEDMKDLTYRMLGAVYLYAGDDIDGDYKLTFDAFSINRDVTLLFNIFCSSKW